jgi:putative SOS response-associated peptidase YedK
LFTDDNLYSITTNQAAIAALFRVINQYVGNLPPLPGVFPDYPAPVIRNDDGFREMIMMRWGMPPPPRFGWLRGVKRWHLQTTRPHVTVAIIALGKLSSVET